MTPDEQEEDRLWDEATERMSDQANAEAAEHKRPKGFLVAVRFATNFEGMRDMDARLHALTGLVPDQSTFDAGRRDCQWEAETIVQARNLRESIESTGEFKATIREH